MILLPPYQALPSPRTRVIVLSHLGCRIEYVAAPNQKERAMANTIDFKFGSLIRTGPKLANGGKWDADLDESVRSKTTNADLTIYIKIFFQQIDPPKGAKAGLHEDADTGEIDPKTKQPKPKKLIVPWNPGEFTRFTTQLTQQAQRFWSGIFWLKTPANYSGLDWPDGNPTHRPNIYCKFDLKAAANLRDAHYTIAVVRVPDTEYFRSHSRLYSQKDIQSEQMISHSTAKFFTHYHEVGHLLGLGHVGHGGQTNVHHDNSPRAYGLTMKEKTDVMGQGTIVRPWHALPWQEAAATFTNTKKDDWKVYLRNHIYPTPLAHGHR